MSRVYRVTINLNTPEGSFPADTLLSQEVVDSWPQDVLINRLRLGDLVPELQEAVEPEEASDDDTTLTAEKLATMTKAEIAAAIKSEYDVDLKEANKESMIAEALAVIEKGTKTE